MRKTLLLSLLLALAGCASTTPPGETVPADGAATAALTDPAACRQAGGELAPLGRLQRVQCVVPYADAGKACSAKADCTGQCLAQGEVAPGAKASGICQTDVRQNFGCRQRIDGGVALGTICVD
ncbi:hypothetical protein D3C87_455810 [compost metagenome]|nr:hypothetical protein [Stenotrophomonas sp.]HCV96805.1 hypothetical protein [Stenotrophomonas sp.]